MSVDDSVHVVHIASGDLWAGAEVQLATLACSQHRLGLCRTSAILLNRGRLQRELEACGIEVTVLDEASLGSLAILRRMIAVLREHKPDIVHTHRIKENVLGSIAARLSGTPSIRSVHGANEHAAAWYQPRSLRHLLDRLCGRWLQRAVVAVTAELATRLEDEYPGHHVRTIENGIDTSIAEKISRVQHKDDRIDIGIVGRLTAVKRVDLFIAAAHRLQHEDPDRVYRFHVYGDGPLQEQLMEQARSLRLQQSLVFHGHSDAIHHDIAALDVLLICSDHEGLPMTLLEAMLLRTAVVAHNVGGMPSVLEQGRCGWLVSEHDADAYAAGIKRCIEDEQDRRARTERAQRRVMAQYSAEANARGFRHLYTELLGR